MENLKKLEKFLEIYGSMYDKDCIDFIKSFFVNEEISYDVPCIVRQIYSALSLVPEEFDTFQGYLESIKKHFSLDQSILEIGSGRYPALARLIDLEQQKLGKGSITIYDEKLVTSNLGNIIINRQLYKSGCEKNTHSLIIGTSPCEATELIIKESNRRKTNLYLSLCECIHNFGYKRFFSVSSYHNYLYKLLIDTLEEDAEITVEYLDDRYNWDLPILIKKKK